MSSCRLSGRTALPGRADRQAPPLVDAAVAARRRGQSRDPGRRLRHRLVRRARRPRCLPRGDARLERRQPAGAVANAQVPVVLRPCARRHGRRHCAAELPPLPPRPPSLHAQRSDRRLRPAAPHAGGPVAGPVLRRAPRRHRFRVAVPAGPAPGRPGAAGGAGHDLRARRDDGVDARTGHRTAPALCRRAGRRRTPARLPPGQRRPPAHVVPASHGRRHRHRKRTAVRPRTRLATAARRRRGVGGRERPHVAQHGLQALV